MDKIMDIIDAAATEKNLASYINAVDQGMAAQEMLEEITGHRVIPDGRLVNLLEDRFDKMAEDSARR